LSNVPDHVPEGYIKALKGRFLTMCKERCKMYMYNSTG
jgi:hypothetical protein